MAARYEYYKPRTIEEAIGIKKNQEKGRYIAGGTDVMVQIRDRLSAPTALVSLRNIEELRGLGKTRIGAGVTHREIERDTYVKERLTALHDAVSVLGSTQIRNVASIGGNIAAARPAADTPPSLLALGARFALTGASGEREVPAAEFFVGPGQTVMAEDEILTAVFIDEPPPFTGTSYMKMGRRKAVDIAMVAVATRITLDKPDGAIKEAKVVLSSVAPKVFYAAATEGLLVGRKPDAALFEKAGSAAADECSPISDIRAADWYRRALVGVLTRRALEQAYLRARGA